VIDYDSFGRLRLADFVAAKRIRRLRDWELEGRVWIGEAIGFSEWLRLSDDPLVLRAATIDFQSFPARAAGRALDALGIPVRRGMTVAELEAVLGRFRRSERFVSDRATYELRSAGPQPFRISCTVLDEGGLSYVGVMTRLPRKHRRAPRVRRAGATAMLGASRPSFVSRSRPG
jgi:hypothetical protein